MNFPTKYNYPKYAQIFDGTRERGVAAHGHSHIADGVRETRRLIGVRCNRKFRNK